MRRFLAAVLICHSLAVLSPNAARAEELVVTVGQYFHPQATDEQRAQLRTIVKNQEMVRMLDAAFVGEHSCVVDNFSSITADQPSKGALAVSAALAKARDAGNSDANAVIIIRNVIRQVFTKCQEEGHITPGVGKP